MAAEISDTKQRLGRVYMWPGTDYVARWVGMAAHDPKRTLRSLALSEVPNAELLCFWETALKYISL